MRDEKDRLIGEVKKHDDPNQYTSELLAMLDYYNVNALYDLTLQEIKEYLIHVI